MPPTHGTIFQMPDDLFENFRRTIDRSINPIIRERRVNFEIQAFVFEWSKGFVVQVLAGLSDLHAGQRAQRPKKDAE